MEFKKNDSVTVSVTDMGQDGEGIGKAEGYTLFIKDAVVGDKVRAKVIKAKKNTEIFWENDYPVFDQNKRFDTKITVSKHRRFPSLILNSMVR